MRIFYNIFAYLPEITEHFLNSIGYWSILYSSIKLSVFTCYFLVIVHVYKFVLRSQIYLIFSLLYWNYDQLFLDIQNSLEAINISIPDVADMLFERCSNSSWVVVFKSLVTSHHLMSNANEVSTVLNWLRIDYWFSINGNAKLPIIILICL